MLLLMRLWNSPKRKKGKKTANFIHAVLQNVFQSSYSFDGLSKEEKLSIEKRVIPYG